MDDVNNNDINNNKQKELECIKKVINHQCDICSSSLCNNNNNHNSSI